MLLDVTNVRNDVKVNGGRNHKNLSNALIARRDIVRKIIQYIDSECFTDGLTKQNKI